MRECISPCYTPSECSELRPWRPAQAAGRPARTIRKLPEQEVGGETATGHRIHRAATRTPTPRKGASTRHARAPDPDARTAVARRPPRPGRGSARVYRQRWRCRSPRAPPSPRRAPPVTTSHHITSHHITSHHITSHHITSHHATSRHIKAHHIQSHWIMSDPQHHIGSHKKNIKITSNRT